MPETDDKAPKKRRTPAPKKMPVKAPVEADPKRPIKDILSRLEGVQPKKNKHTEHMLAASAFVFNSIVQVFAAATINFGPTSCTLRGRVLALDLLRMMDEENYSKLPKKDRDEAEFYLESGFMRLSGLREEERKKEARQKVKKAAKKKKPSSEK